MSSANMTMVLIAGEQSSDEYGAKLIHSIRQAFPQVHIAVIGGTSMEKAADECIANITHHSPVGIVEQVWHRRKYHRVLDALERYCESNRIHRVLIMDFPHYHHKVAKIIQPYSIPIYTFITPHFWIWKDKKMAKTIADYSQKIFTIFEEEYELYR